MDKKTERRFLLSILHAWKDDSTSKEVPWHITDLGWVVYANHPDGEIRKAALENPYFGCPSEHLQRRRKSFKLKEKAIA